MTPTLPCRAQTPQDAIHPKERFFTPDDVRKALAGQRTGVATTLPGGVSTDAVTKLINDAVANPERFRSTLDMLQKAAGNLPLEKLVRDPNNVDPRIREFAESLARNPTFRERLLDNPEFRKLADTVRDRIDRSGGRPSSANPSADPKRPSDANAALERAGKAWQRLLSGDSGAGSTGRAERGSPLDTSRWDRLWRSRDPNRESTARRSRVNSEFRNGRESRDDNPFRMLDRFRSDANGRPDSESAQRAAVKEPGSTPAGNSEVGASPSERPDDWFSWFSKRASKAGEWGARTGERLGGWLPKMPSFKVPTSRIPQFRVPTLQIPGSGMTEILANPPSMSGLGMGLLFVLGAMGLVAFVLGMSNKLVASRSRNAHMARWVRRRPDATPGEKIRWLFEDAALDRLGDDAATMNHLAIAQRLSAQATAERATEARQFADLYEKVRYAPHATSPTEEELAMAIRCSQAIKAN